MSAIIIIDDKPTEVSDDARREIMRLRSENAMLRDEVESLKSALEALVVSSMAKEEQP